MEKNTDSSSKEETESEKNPNASDDFVAPDGGWGWMIVVAAGFSNFCILPVVQSFGLLFRDRFLQLGINYSETTTIINMNSAVTACIGLLNGPLFKRYSYRQVSFVGALICAMSITILSTTKTFTGALIFFSILYGAGVGITMSANALALNTYFKEKRRIATGLSWTCTGMGPIVMPQIITVLVPMFGTQGTILIFGGFAFNAVACSLLLQPVSLHISNTKTSKEGYNEVSQEMAADKNSLQNGTSLDVIKYHSHSLESVENGKAIYDALGRAKPKFGSQYLYYDDEEDGASGIDVISPGTPMMSRANDGWFSKRNASNTSLASRSSKRESNQKPVSRKTSLNLSRPPSVKTLNRGPSIRTLNRQNSDNERRRRNISTLQPSATPLIILSESCEHTDDDEKCKEIDCNRHAEESSATVEKIASFKDAFDEKIIEEPAYKSFLKAVVIFFDLDLLRDSVYVTLMLGITFANFAELNFSLLTPFILGEYGFSKIQVATVMSVLAGVDVLTRITIPFLASFISWENRTFFLVGVSGMAIGRIVLAHVQDFGISMAVAILIGAGKALRTIFMALVIPSHVPLSRLPAATGLQLLVSGIVFLTLGPVVGWIRDSTNYTIMLHFLNIFTYLTAISWITEDCLRKRQRKRFG
ncbi:hypothetical protein KPH14_008615 [Odynerus spinipes]|uniref:Uncharacterized protein n=1 Tax=Odynerus spinipes TaxID=1348599 RepID=A0AAD9RSW6_9HYME|nr:hypothetical protein KPH14_008615 [Odynerus spinipes]